MSAHELNLARIAEVDEVCGDEQHCLVWCKTHRAWEWHWLQQVSYGLSNPHDCPLAKEAYDFARP